MSDEFNMSQSSAHRCTVEVLTAFCNIMSSFVSWPNICEKTASFAAFNTKCGIPGINGATDGCHIKIQRPNTRGGELLERITILLFCKGSWMSQGGNIFVGAPGKVHDARILRKSIFLENWKEKMGRFMLLGDSAYIAYPFVITPKRNNGALTIQDQLNNSKISRG